MPHFESFGAFQNVFGWVTMLVLAQEIILVVPPGRSRSSCSWFG